MINIDTPTGLDTVQLNIEARVTFRAKTLEPYLEQMLKTDTSRLMEAVRYGVLGVGKRIRPFLVAETVELLLGLNQVDNTLVYEAACAIEFVHCYSLIHDDLPAMDDDDLRRGRPTLHKAYDEATAILAGDALLTLAFETLAVPVVNSSKQLLLVKELAHASGMQGMVAGQMLDLAAEGRFEANGASKTLSKDDVMRLQSLKTGALIKCAVRMGAIIGSASAAQLKALDIYADNLGLAFQIADDLIDHEGDADIAGKATAKDIDKSKATFVSLFGADGARQELNTLIEKTATALSIFGSKADVLLQLMRYMAVRKF